jgi:hypothetical protein
LPKTDDRLLPRPRTVCTRRGRDHDNRPATSLRTSTSGRASGPHSPSRIRIRSGSKRSTRFAAGKPAFRKRPIALRSPPLLYRNSELRIIVPGPLRFRSEAACGVGLLLFWPAAFFRSLGIPATLGFQVLLFTAVPSGCPFSRFLEIPGRSVFQAPVRVPEGSCTSFSSFPAEAVHSLRPCDSISERTFPVFIDLPGHRLLAFTRFLYSGLRLS